MTNNTRLAEANSIEAVNAAANNKPNLLTFDNRNAKLGPDVYVFNLPAGWTCPGAKECHSRVNPKTGKLEDGPDCKFRCFAASEEAKKNVSKSRFRNLRLLQQVKTTSGMTELIEASLPSTSKIRIHSSGDFWGQEYFDSWLAVSKQHPSVAFWAYTKSLPFWIARLGSIPSNFVLTASYGGKYDSQISEFGLRSARVVFSLEEAAHHKLEVDHDDSHARAPGPSFALLLHSVQPAGSLAAAALIELKRRGIQYSYRRPSAGPLKRPLKSPPGISTQPDQLVAGAAVNPKKIELIALNSIHIDESVSARGNSLNQDYIDEIKDCLDTLPPVSLFDVGGKKILVDGFHRYRAFADSKRKTIPSIMLGSGSIIEAKDTGDLANLRHGLRLTQQQRREVARRFHERHPDWTARHVGKLMNMAHTTILGYWEEGCGLNRIHKPSPVTPTELLTASEPDSPTPTALADEPTSAPSQPAVDRGAQHQQCKCPNCGFEFKPASLNLLEAA